MSTIQNVTAYRYMRSAVGPLRIINGLYIGGRLVPLCVDTRRTRRYVASSSALRLPDRDLPGEAISALARRSLFGHLHTTPGWPSALALSYPEITDEEAA